MVAYFYWFSRGCLFCVWLTYPQHRKKITYQDFSFLFCLYSVLSLGKYARILPRKSIDFKPTFLAVNILYHNFLFWLTLWVDSRFWIFSVVVKVLTVTFTQWIDIVNWLRLHCNLVKYFSDTFISFCM